ncbi:hypothetical protein J4457_01850 [Candidatus Woesearchaeota archaeon]|nr:hypothetical protein [Candidatus Woesearchaeota archaeon]
MGDQIEHNCGVAAVAFLRRPDIRRHPHGALPSLRDLMLTNQNRGEEGAGFLAVDDSRILEPVTRAGSVEDLFHMDEKELHYELLQPWSHQSLHQASKFGFCFNGNIANWEEIRELLQGICRYHFDLEVDTEILETILRQELRAPNPVQRRTLESKLRRGLVDTNEELARRYLENITNRKKVQAWSEIFAHLANLFDGAWNIIIARSSYNPTNDVNGELVLARDIQGFRPLWYAVYEREGIFAASSESAGLDSLNIPSQSIHRLPEGTFIQFKDGKITGPKEYIRKRGQRPRQNTQPIAHCFFENHYFSQANSRVDVPTKPNVVITNYDQRYDAGRLIAQSDPLRKNLDRELTVVVAVPNAARPFAEGLAEGLGLSARQEIIKVHEGGGSRTFLRDHGERKIERAYSFNPSLQGKRVILADDSIVRLNTLPEVIAALVVRGVSEIHARIGTPPIIGPCYYGINIRTLQELGAADYAEQYRLQCTAQRKKVDMDEMVRFIEGSMLPRINDKVRSLLQERYQWDTSDLPAQPLRSLRYLRHSELKATYNKIGVLPEQLCMGCLYNRYPTEAGQQRYEQERISTFGKR